MSKLKQTAAAPAPAPPVKAAAPAPAKPKRAWTCKHCGQACAGPAGLSAHYAEHADHRPGRLKVARTPAAAPAAAPASAPAAVNPRLRFCPRCGMPLLAIQVALAAAGGA